MKKKYYLAYGSNLNVSQMRTRCPQAVIMGTSELKGWELLFKGSKTGSYLTIESCENGSVPVAVWEVSENDEKALDRYEGYPTFYYKKEIKIQYKNIHTNRNRTIMAFVYIMHEDRPIGIPSEFYLRTCQEGYETFRFDKQVLINAFKKSEEGVYEKENHKK